MDDENYEIELSKNAILSARKLFDMLTHSALLELGFEQSEIDSLGDLYLEVKSIVEQIEITEK